MIAIDTEFYRHTGKLHRPGGNLACLTTSEKNFVVEDKSNIRDYLQQLKTADTIALMHAEYDIRQLRACNLWPENWMPKVWDIMLVEQALFGGWYQLNSLADLARRWLGIHLDKSLGQQFVEIDTMTAKMKKYAVKDADITLQIAQAQQKYIKEQMGGDFNWYWNIDLPAMWAILDMQPIRIDVDGWLKHAEDLYAEGMKIQRQLGFNVKSTQQVKKALRKVGINARNTTDVNALENWLEKAQIEKKTKQIELLTAIMRARKCRDAMSKYGVNWIENNVERDEWVYPNWNVIGAATGRMSSSDPNMQNIPKRGEEGSIYRTFFLASKEHKLLIGDVQQQEPRFSAHMSQDPKLMQEIIDGVDLHQRAADFFNITGTKKERRDKGKAINLGLNYGMSAYGLAARLGISVDEAEAGLRTRRRNYSRYYAWQDRQIRHADRRKFVVTASGRPVWVNPYSFKAKRNAINGPIQGSAADHTKLALAYVHQQCRAEGVPFVANLVVHDEIVLDVPNGMMTQYEKILDNAWKEAGHKLMPSMPTIVDMASGLNWGAE